jgi:hypothetical protein
MLGKGIVRSNEERRLMFKVIVLCLILVGCSAKSGSWDLVKCGIYTDCEVKYNFSTEKECIDMMTKLTNVYSGAFSCSKVP